MKRYGNFSRVLALAVCMLLLTSTALAEVSPKDDFYAAVNAEWLAEAEIPADQAGLSAFVELDEGIRQVLMADFAAMRAAEERPEGALGEFLALYDLADDWEARNAAGGAPIRPYLDEIQALGGYAELNEKLADWMLAGMALPLTVTLDADFVDGTQYAVYLMAPSPFLPDASYYAEENEAGQYLRMAATAMLEQMLQLADFTEAEAAGIVENAMAFDAMIAPLMPTGEESASVASLYNPVTMEELAEISTVLNLGAMVEALVGTQPGQVSLASKAYFEGIDSLMAEENFPLLRDWMTATMMATYAQTLSEDYRALAFGYEQLLTGQAEMVPPDRAAYAYARDIFAEVVGQYYGQTYFGKDARADVVQMVEALIDQYKAMLQGNEWLSEETREKAVAKLDGMILNIGYPDEVRPEYALMKVTPAEAGGTLLSNTMALGRVVLSAHFARYKTPVDRHEWPLAADMVNAMYSQLSNSINFPAAILQAPYYEPEWEASAKLGGIGVVIAHEITHAFDPNGALFDELGNYVNWWTEADYLMFATLSELFVSAFDGIEHAGGTVNGRQTLSENVADAGGLRCAMEVTKRLDDADLVAFFETYATIWRSVYQPEYESLILAMDVHAPDKVRVNRQVQMLNEFYETFGIEEADGMYLPEGERVALW